MITKWIASIIASLVWLGTPICAQESSQTHDKIEAVTTSEAAVERAVAYTGFDKAEGYDPVKSVKAEKVLIENDNTPFVADKINGRMAWKVYFKDIPVGQQSAVIRNRDFEVTLDPETGKLIKIFSVSDDAGSSDTLPQPSADVAERWFTDRKYVFEKLPDKMCKFTFWEALQKVRIASPSVTKIIKAYYWDYSDRGGEHPYTWLIILRGIEEPIPNAGPVKSPDWSINFSMVVVEAITGRPQGTTTAPYDKKDAKRRSLKK